MFSYERVRGPTDVSHYDDRFNDFYTEVGLLLLARVRTLLVLMSVSSSRSEDTSPPMRRSVVTT